MPSGMGYLFRKNQFVNVIERQIARERERETWWECTYYVVLENFSEICCWARVNFEVLYFTIYNSCYRLRLCSKIYLYYLCRKVYLNVFAKPGPWAYSKHHEMLIAIGDLCNILQMLVFVSHSRLPAKWNRWVAMRNECI